MLKILVFALIFVACDGPSTTGEVTCEQVAVAYCEKEYECAELEGDILAAFESCKAFELTRPCERVRPMQCMQAIHRFEWDCSTPHTLDDWRRFDAQVSRECFVLDE